MIAFFDFDGTLIKHDSGVICALPVIKRGMLGPRIGARLIGTFLLSKVGLRTRGDAQKVGFACYGGHTLAELREAMESLYQAHVRRYLSRPMLERVEHHRRIGDKLVLITASAFFFAEPIGRELNLTEVHGTQVGWDADGKCTGWVDGEIVEGQRKLAQARSVAAQHGVDLARCAFYSDHIADLPLLEAVGTPVVVGPHRPLRKIAEARGWPIMSHGED